MIWRMFMAVTMHSVTFMRRDYLNNSPPFWTRWISLKQMFDISTKLVSEQDEISGVETLGWENHSWKYLSLIGDERVINLQRTKVYVFSDSVLCLGSIHQYPNASEAWKERIEGITTDRSYRDYDGISGEPTEFEWNIFPGFTTLQLSGKVKDLLSRFVETPENFTGRILFMSMFNDISCGTKDNEKECLANAKVVSILAKKIWCWTMVIHWSRFWEKVVFYGRGESTRNLGQNCWKDVGGIRRKHMSNFPRFDPIVQRSTQKQRPWKTVDTLCNLFGNGWDYFSYNCFCEPVQAFTEQSRRYIKSMNPFTRERRDPLWWGNRVPHSCSVSSRQKYLGILMTLLAKIFCCKDTENESKSCHNKTN